MNASRCIHLVERNGYFTGRRCTREATKVVIFNKGTDNEDPRPCCTQHANKLVKQSWHNPPSVEPIR